MNKELEKKIYSMSNSFLPLDVFYNDIRDNPVENYNKEQAYKDIEIIADFIIDLQSQLDHQKAMWNELKEILKRQIDIDSKEYLESGFAVFKNYVAVENFILQKMQELEGEDE